ncbi:hypothetical protein CO540_21485 [Micromonospora sp. WMMA2032]|uniref:Copper(I)-binding protein n=1 Tax=Micromonospora sediminicola TaxID=946078 RepID=A0A1A9B4N1_9ACTN|nr:MULTISPECIES: hypothetical protein [Micromonospora]ATO16077.1 hypothetical protein CO540_21485 [Micromonospora sp. WMMA2032]PGH41250.1 hypothetical protein COO58_25775 [Micromonospora sp. WMMA1996]SBT63862.1 hypothetical protein GA0070622_0828 [Micromonospora sediminicola]
MTRSIRGSRGPALLLAGTAAAASLLLSGCGAGQIAETANKIPSVQGVNVQTSDNLYKVRGLYVQFPGPKGYEAGATAPLNVVIYNDSQAPVTVTVTTDSAREILLTGGAGSSGAATPTGSPTEPASASPTAADPSASPSQSLDVTGSPSAGESASASPSPSESESAPAGQPARIEIPALSYAQLNSGNPQFLQLVGLNQKLLVGQQVNLTFDFGGGKVIKTPAPIGVPLTPEAEPSAVVNPREHAGEEGGVEGGSHG